MPDLRSELCSRLRGRRGKPRIPRKRLPCKRQRSERSSGEHMTLVQANELAATNEAPPDLRSVHQLRLRTLRVSVGVLKDNEVA